MTAAGRSGAGVPRRRALLTGPIAASAQAVLGAAAHVDVASDTSADGLRAAARRAEVIIVRHPLPPDIFDAAPSLLAAVRHGTGLDYIPIEAATRLGVLVANVPGANATAVAEYCAMQALSLLRRPQRAERLLRELGAEPARLRAPKGLELAGSTCGIIGFGAIGSRVARILHFGFEARVIVHVRRPEALPDWVRPVALPELAAQADLVVPCVPYSAETRHLISAPLIARMKPSALLVNASRGGVIDQAALVDALERGYIAGAALDVFEEPEPQPNDRLLAVPNLHVTPKISGGTENAHKRIGAACVAEVLRVLAGEKPRNLVNPDAWTRHEARRTTAYVQGIDLM
ncbi:MAG: hydroxyacid dehydrogenase [Burkholderiales bacterium]|nr:hydroxyacid dehydrogenase [Burkholderiales bacterium]